MLKVANMYWNYIGMSGLEVRKNKALTSSIQPQNRSFHVVERTKTTAKCRKMKNARAKRANLMVKYANL